MVESVTEAICLSADEIKEAIEEIPPGTNRIDLLKLLDPVFRELAMTNEAMVEACLKEVIGPRFGLKPREIRGYREIIKGHRKREGVVCSGPSEKTKRQVRYTANFEDLVDLVEHEGKTAFLVKEGDGVRIQSEISLDGVEYLPPLKGKLPWLLCPGKEVVKLFEAERSTSDEKMYSQLYDDLWARQSEISELPSEEHYDLVTAWVLHTYLMESFQYSPIICLHAVPERGKSRTGKGMIYVAYRGLHTESMREAYILRVAQDLKASILFDVRDIWKKASKEDSDDVLLCRFEKGLKVARVLYPEKGAHQDMEYYDVFGPTVIATNQAVHKILDTRAVTINMLESRRDFEGEVRPEDALPMKLRLMVFRARQMGRPLPEVPKPAKARLGDILKPLVQVIHLTRPERKEAFMQLVAKLVERRGIDKADSLEAKLISTIFSLKGEVNRGILPVQLITDTINKNKPDRFQFTPQRIGRELSALGFQKGKTGAGASAIVYDDDYMQRLIDSYNPPQTSETSETSET
ncbi:MAG: hypothetical protein WCE90_12445 [Candidatus Zixiibacteriota bacterium]